MSTFWKTWWLGTSLYIGVTCIVWETMTRGHAETGALDAAFTAGLVTLFAAFFLTGAPAGERQPIKRLLHAVLGTIASLVANLVGMIFIPCLFFGECGFGS